jgi:putative transposase
MEWIPMADYQRLFVPGGTYFFTVVTAYRKPWLTTDAGRTALGQAMRDVRGDQPFETVAFVLLPDHLHAIWVLPDNDADFSRRWRRIKQRTSIGLRKVPGFTGPFWQARFWEHWVRDEEDLQQHIDYIHYNPVKHGWVSSPVDWQASTFHRFVAEGLYAADWGGPVDMIEVPE